MNPEPKVSRSALHKLRRSWVLFTFITMSYLILGGAGLGRGWQAQAGVHWAILAGLAAMILLFVLWRNLDQNYRPGEGVLLGELGWGNWMTLLRGLLIASMAGFLFLPRPPGGLAWLPGILYCSVIAADSLDGYLARRSNYATKLGSILDISFDGLGVLAGAGLLIQYGQVPVGYILVALARYLFLGGGWILGRSGRSLRPLQPSAQRRIFASIQFVFIAAVLFPLFPTPLTRVAAVFFAVPFLAGFGIDFLQVSGVWDGRDHPLLPAQAVGVIQTIIRLGVVSLALFALGQTRRADLPVEGPGELLLALGLLMAFLVLVGAAGRISSGIALVLIGLGQWYFPPSMVQILQIAGYIAIIYMGSGPYSLWSPEESWYYTAGELKARRASRNLKHETLLQTD